MYVNVFVCFNNLYGCVCALYSSSEPAGCSDWLLKYISRHSCRTCLLDVNFDRFGSTTEFL